MSHREIARIYQNISEQNIGIPPSKPGGTASDTLRGILKKNPKYGGKPEDVIDRPGERLQKAHFEPEGELVENYYDEVFSILLEEGYSEKDANKIMVMFVTEGLWDNIVKTFKQRTSSLKNVARAGATDLAATAIGASPTPQIKSANASPAPIVRQVAAKPPAQPPTIGQVAKNVASRISNAVQPRLMGSRTIANLAAGKPGGSLGNVVNTQVVKPNVKTGNLASANLKGSPVSPRTGGSSSVSKPGVRTPGGPLEKAGPTVDVKSNPGSRISQSVPRLRIPRVSSPTPAAAAGTGAGGAATGAGILPAVAAGTALSAATSMAFPGRGADGTLTGALKRGDLLKRGSGYKPKQDYPKNPDEGLSRAQSFDKTFAKARKSGAKEFEWRGNRYNTKLKGES